jgi:class 3 adenylate cyclase
VDVGELVVGPVTATGRAVDTTMALVRDAAPGVVLVTTVVRDLLDGSGVAISPCDRERLPRVFKVGSISSS